MTVGDERALDLHVVPQAENRASASRGHGTYTNDQPRRRGWRMRWAEWVVRLRTTAPAVAPRALLTLLPRGRRWRTHCRG